MPSPIKNFPGISNADNQALLGSSVLPPDTNGDVGPAHYVQIVNLLIAVYDKNSGALMAGFPKPVNSLWSGFGGPCQTTNDGDPIVLYDQLANRWLVSQLALPSFPNGPFFQCIAVSTTSDPTGAYNRYSYQMPGNKLNDYPKFGVWPDAYYMSVNQFNAGALTWGGQGVAAFDRSKMFLGLPANMVYFDLFSVNPNFGGMLPADLDGSTPPPTGSP